MLAWVGGCCLERCLLTFGAGVVKPVMAAAVRAIDHAAARPAAPRTFLGVDFFDDGNRACMPSDCKPRSARDRLGTEKTSLRRVCGSVVPRDASEPA